MKRTTGIPWKRAGGFSLIEVTIALGIAAFCLVTVFALLPIGLNSNQQSFENTVAGNLSSAIVADLRSVPITGANATPRFGIVIPIPPSGGNATTQTSGTTLYLSANGIASPNGQVVLTGTAVSRYRATIGFYIPPSPQNLSPGQSSAAPSRLATSVRILITWPALADPQPESWNLSPSAPSDAWPKNYNGSYETDTTLDCN